MPISANRNYPRRHNRDGSHDSICPACLVTIASRQDEEELYPFEVAHVCDPLRLFSLGKLESFDHSRVNGMA